MRAASPEREHPGRGSPTAWVGRLQMSKRKWLFGVAALALIAIAVLLRSQWTTESARSQPRAERVVPVETALAERKKVPVRLDALGSVTPIASVALKARVDTNITAVHFSDGALVKQGDLLFTLDGRAIEAQIAQTEGAIARDQAQLERSSMKSRARSAMLAAGSGLGSRKIWR